jgi:hypothetical protein
MQKTLFKSKRGAFKIELHPNVLLIGCFNDDDEFVIAILQIAFVFSKPAKKKKY